MFGYLTVSEGVDERVDQTASRNQDGDSNCWDLEKTIYYYLLNTFVDRESR